MTKATCIAIFSVTLLFGCVAADTSFTDCGSTGQVKKLQVLDCQNPPCTIKLNSNVTAFLHFNTSGEEEMIENLTSSFSVILTPEIVIPFPNIRKDVCSRFQYVPPELTNEAIIKECPIAPGSDVIYYTVLEITDEYPTISTTIRWTLTDQSNNTVTCVEVPFDIV